MYGCESWTVKKAECRRINVFEPRPGIEPVSLALAGRFFITREALYSQQKQDQELTVTQIMNSLFFKFRLKLKKVQKTTRPFRYDLKQIPYDYTVEVRNRFKGLDLIDRVPGEL